VSEAPTWIQLFAFLAGGLVIIAIAHALGYRDPWGSN